MSDSQDAIDAILEMIDRNAIVAADHNLAAYCFAAFCQSVAWGWRWLWTDEGLIAAEPAAALEFSTWVWDVMRRSDPNWRDAYAVRWHDEVVDFGGGE